MGSELAARLAARHLKLAQFCGFDLVELNLKSKGKKGVIKEIANLLAKSHNVESEEAAFEALIEREDLASTGIGYGIAVPHGKSQHCKGLTIAFGRSCSLLIRNSCPYYLSTVASTDYGKSITSSAGGKKS